jgi:thiosulfate/3-mercaptopyruvate sulfurtransferase
MANNAGYARPELLAEPDWVWANHRNPRVRIIDCGAPSGCGTGLPERQTVEDDFLPRAVYLPVHPFLKDAGSGHVHVMTAEDFAETMRALGVSKDTSVVAYDRFNGAWAARLWWVLRYYGHTDARVLNGGWARWVAENRPTARAPAEVARGDWEPRPGNASMLCRIDDVRAHVDGGGQLVNVLWRDWYTGKVNPTGWKRVGHIPGSINIPIEEFMAEPHTGGKLKAADELRSVLRDAGISPEKPTVIYCAAGVRTSHAHFVMSLLGWTNISGYDASMTEWANRDDTALAATV